MCEMFNALPRSGGIYDQDPYFMESVKLLMAARAEKTELERKKNA